MERRSIFEMIFGNKKQDISKYEQMKLLNDERATFTKFNNQIYTTAQIRSCIDTIARNVAKLNPKHIRYYYEGDKQRIEEIRTNIHRLITRKPNELMNAYDFYYKIASHLFEHNNAYVFISRATDGTPIGLYPIEAREYKMLEYKNEPYIQFKFKSNVYVASLKDDVIHLRRFFANNEIMGETNDPIIRVMSIKHIIDEGIVNAIKTTQGIKGILKEQKAMLKPDDVKKKRDQFVQDFIENNGSGIASIDSTAEFIPVNINPKTAEESQIKQINDEIYNYFGINEKILQSSYNEDEWNAFYENVIEPVAIQLGLEFTNKIFSIGERFHGNEIVFESNRLQYASTTSKINVLKEAGALGILTINEAREILNLSPVDDGDQRVQSLNYTDKGGTNE